MNAQESRRVAALRTVAETRIAAVPAARLPDAYVSVAPKELGWLADQAAPHADDETSQKVADLKAGAVGADTRDDAEVHLRATDLLVLCDLVDTAPGASSPLDPVDH